MTFAPICVPCHREMRCRKNGYFFKDYQGAAVWAGDMFECPACQHQTIVGVGRGPVSLEGENERAEKLCGFELTRDP